MPIYEYICKKCNFSTEMLEKITEDKKNLCPKCKTDLNKIISKSYFNLKGNGWYKTDYKKNNEKENK